MLTPLRVRLERSRARARSLLLLRGALWSALAAGGSYLVLYLVALWRPLPLPTWVWAALIFALALTVSSVWALLRTPSLLELARRADRDFGLRERVSTALELARMPASAGAEGELAAALLADAARHAPAIEPQRLVPLRFPRVGWWLVGLASGLVALEVVGPQLFPGSQIESEVASPLNAVERRAVVADIRRTSNLLGGEAEERKDPYLGALAQAFDDLGRRVASGALDRAATERELDRLLGHVARAYEGEPSPFGAASAQDAGIPAPPPGAAAEAQGSPVAQEPAEAPRSAERGTDSSTEGDTTSLGDLLSELGQVEANLQRASSEREANEGRITAVDYAEFGPYITPDSLERLKREREEREAQQARAGQPVGAAEEANRGPGDLAGEGVQPLAGEDAALDTLAAGTRREQVRLPDGRAGAGERVRLERAPDAQFSEVAEGERPSGAAWRARREAELRREQLGPRERALASRYFSRGGSSPARP